MSRWQGSWLVWAWLLLPGFAWGQEPLLIPRSQGASEIATADAPLKLSRSSNLSRGSTSATAKSSGVWGTVGSLFVVLGIIATVAYLYSRHGVRLPGMLPADVIQVLGKRYLDSKNSLQLIRCGSKILVVANSTQHGLTTLTEITDPLEVEQLTSQCLPASANGTISNPPHLASHSRNPLNPLGPGAARV